MTHDSALNPEAKIPLPDARARVQALDPSHSFIVQAPAGSGKTSLLVERFVTLLSEVSQVEEVVAITHTRKAANEMRQRITQRLQAPSADLDQALSDAIMRNHGSCVQSIVARLQVTTIDSLCQRLAHGSTYHQLNFGEAQIADNPKGVYRKAVSRVLTQLWTPQPNAHLVRLWNHYGCDADKLEKALVAMLAKREQWLDVLVEQKKGGSSLAQCQEHWHRLWLAQSAVLKEAEHIRFAQSCKVLHAKVKHWMRYCEDKASISIKTNQAFLDLDGATDYDTNWWRALYRWLSTQDGTIIKQESRLGFPSNTAVKGQDKKDLVRDKEDAKEILKALQENTRLYQTLVDLVDEKLPPEQGQLLESLTEVAISAVAQLHLVFAQQQTLDFIQVAHGALDALTHYPETTPRISHLLVDEFQDTSPTQWNLFEKLTELWQEGNSIFVVGDPMQSIYAFRQAEVELFGRAQQQGIGSVPLTPLRLESNFRSHRGLVTWCNTMGASLLGNSTQSTFATTVDFAPAFSASSLAANAEPQLHVSAIDRRMVDLIHQIKQLAAGTSVGILVQKRALGDAIMTALDQAGIGYKALDMCNMSQQQHIVDLCNLIRLCFEPEHWRHWLGVLRAPQIGMPLALCSALFQSNSNPQQACRDWLVEQPTPDTQDMHQRLQWLLERLVPQLQQRGLRPLAQLVENLWHSLGFAALLSTQAHSECLTLLGYIQQQVGGNWWIDWAEVDEWLAEKTSSLEREHTADSPAVTINLMTCHKAKGLEFDVVFLPYADNSFKTHNDTFDPFIYDQLLIDNTPSLLMAAGPDSRHRVKHPNYQFLKKHQTQKLAAERRRLLYVALTRAKKQLVVMGDTSVAKANSFWQWLDEVGAATSPENAHATPTPAGANAQPDEYPRIVLTQLRNFSALTQQLTEPLPSLGFGTTRKKLQWEPNRLLGICLHSIMQELHALHIDSQDKLMQIVAERQHHWCARLQKMGMPAGLFSQECQRLKDTLQALAQDARCLWLLAPHAEKQCEWSLIAFDRHAQKTRKRVVDLTFCNEQVRWIIDYKAVNPLPHESPTALCQRVQTQYQDTMTDYAAIVSGIANLPTMPIRLGLYLLLQQQWVEWSYTQ